MALHQPLPKGHIRLLHLEAGDGIQPIRAKLVEASLSVGCPSYEALSYTWGSDEKQSIIICNENVLPITENLFCALLHLRQLDQHRIIWIDAICINQSNTQEQTEQVLMMKSIYKQASHVVIWLGEETSSDAAAFMMLENFQAEFTKRGFFHFALRDFFDGFPRDDDDGWVALANLFQRPWFLRVWVIQEAVNACRATVFCGSLRASWELIVQTAQCLTEHGAIGRYDLTEAAPGVNSVRVMEIFKTIDDVPLLTSLRVTRQFQATDARDHVFALMGLTPDNKITTGKKVTLDTKSQGGYIDYDTTDTDLFMLVAEEHLVYKKSLEYLSYGGLSSASPGWTLPSWVVDWTYRNDRRVTLGSSRPVRFRAAGETSPNMSISSSRILKIQGYVVGTISRLDSFIRLADDTTTVEVGDEAWNLFKKRKTILDKEQMRRVDEITKDDFFIPEGQTREEAIWRTLCCDVAAPFGRRASPESVISYQWYRKALDLVDENGALDEIRFAKDEWLIQNRWTCGPTLNTAKMYNTARHLCLTSQRNLGCVPKGSAVHDVICIFLGGSVPFVLRGNGDRDGVYQLVGECYIHGMMDGEVLKRPDLDSLVRDFQIR